ncbi:MAG: tetratricopeptide repeat protein [Limisphaerales bacterium]
MKSRPKALPAAALPPVPRHKWLFRFLALLIIPLLVLGLLEVALRVADYGYPTSFFEKVRLNGQDYLLNNEKFGLRFFPPELNRWTRPLMMEAVKPPDTCRIFIFGESAAQGDPAPSFGAGRYLEALLRERYPGVNFEVINLGITAISSHVILPVARECARCQGDLWIVYMGNNEMIGPFGAATVFGAKALPWPAVRLGVALQATRAGQLLMNIERKLRGYAAAPRVWRGLSMFLGNQLDPDDPRKEVVYKNFQRNLQDILRAGREAGVPIILNTVAVNLKDCPPFASLYSSRLTPANREQFDRFCLEGRGAQMSNDWKTAASDFGKAVALDPQMAEAQFREGECVLQLNDTADAVRHFQKACDCDALVFRADSRINGIIRETGRQLGGPGLELCDAAASLPEPGAIAGQETFYEHVHFNFDGNYRLARLWAAQAEGLLPENVRARAKGSWASQEVCEARLGLTDWNRNTVLKSVLGRMEGLPLNTQFNNAQRISDLTARIDLLLRQRDTTAAANARALYIDAIARAPRDYMLHENYGEFLQLTGDLDQAALEWRQAQELMPRNEMLLVMEGALFELKGDLTSAQDFFRQAVNIHPSYGEALFELGKIAGMEGKLEEAVQNYRRSAEFQPDDAPTYLNLGEALVRLKRTDASVPALRHAVELRADYLEAHYALGEVLGLQGRFAEAKAEFQQVVHLQPRFAKGHLNLGIVLLKLNDTDAARREFAETLSLDPGNKLAQAYLAEASK